MHGSILAVTIPPPPPPRKPAGQVQPFGPKGGELIEVVMSRGEGAGQIENNFSFFLVKHVTSQLTQWRRTT